MIKEDLILTNDEIENILSKINVARNDECWEWTLRVNSAGRPIYSISRDKDYVISVQRVILQNHLGHTISSRYIDVVCGNLLCCNPIHLRGRDLESRLWGNVKLKDDTGCWEWRGAVSGESGYGVITVAGKSKATHRVSYELSTGEIPGGLMVLHKCNNRICINPEHLYLGTHNDNMQDMVHVNSVKGENNAMALLTESDVLEIRKLIASRMVTYNNIAQQYGVKRQTIKDIATGRTWAWLK